MAGSDFIIGNPPFLGGKLLRSGLGDATVETLFRIYAGRVPAEADLVCYWFAKAWEALESKRAKRVGLVATNSIRGCANRKVLGPIAEVGGIFEARSDEAWTIEGAAVRVSLVCFKVTAPLSRPHPEEPRGGVSKDRGVAQDGRARQTTAPGRPSFETAASPPPQDEESSRMDAEPPRLNGLPMPAIHADLSAERSNLVTTLPQPENLGVAFMGDTKGGAVDVEGQVARASLAEPLNPTGRPNSDVLSPWVNGLDVTRRAGDMWIIDFGWTMSEGEASLYEAPFQHSLASIKPFRLSIQQRGYAKRWWIHERPRPEMWAALRGDGSRHGRARPGHPRPSAALDGVDARHKTGHDAGRELHRYIATPTVTRHRLFVWIDRAVCPDHQLIAIARDDDTTFGVLHSRLQEAWSLRLGTRLGVGNDPRYTPTTAFETFPFPEGLTPNIPAADYADDPRAQRVAAAPKRLDELRRAWLNPPDLVDIVPEITPTAAPGEAPRKYPDRLLPKNAKAGVKLKERTLTKLYNERPRWLADARDALDRAVAASYGWPEDIATEDALARLLALNLERTGTKGSAAPALAENKSLHKAEHHVTSIPLPRKDPTRWS